MRLPALLTAAAVAALPAPALSQHSDHAGHVNEAYDVPAEHAEHARIQEAPPSPHSEHEGHAPKPVETADPHAGHSTQASEPPEPSGPPPEAFSGPEHAADSYFGDTAMARARADLGRMHGAVPAYKVLIDRLEGQWREGADGYLVDAQAWYGGDIDKLWIKTEGEGTFQGDFDALEIQVLWSHAVGPWFDLQAGVRYDAQDGPDRTHLVLGVQGLAPYWFEIDAAALLSDKGDLTGVVESEHNIRITQTLILQPRAEVEWSLQDIPEQAIGSGLTHASLGARLRYQITPLLAPYLGVEYDRAFGETRDLRRAAHERVGGFSFLAGIRAWF